MREGGHLRPPKAEIGQCENDLTLDAHSLSERGPGALTRLVEPPRNTGRAAALTSMHGMPHIPAALRFNSRVRYRGRASVSRAV